MYYPKAKCCPFNTDDEKMPLTSQQPAVRAESIPQPEPEHGCNNSDNESHNGSKHEMMQKIQKIDFAIIDLNLFLDTHPNCKEAIELFTKLAATSRSLKSDFQRQYGPLYAANSQNSTPFAWVHDDYKWPWQKQEVK